MISKIQMNVFSSEISSQFLLCYFFLKKKKKKKIFFKKKEKKIFLLFMCDFLYPVLQRLTLQYFIYIYLYLCMHIFLENSMDRGASWTMVHGVAELDTTEQLTLYTMHIFVYYL